MSILRSHTTGVSVSPTTIHRGCPFCAATIRINSPKEGLVIMCTMCEEPCLYQQGELHQAVPDDDGAVFGGRDEYDP